jgi:RimJ/RimL family protein N-acetyltransferase
VTRADAPLFEAELCDPVMMEHLGGPISSEDARATLERQLDPERTWSFVIVTDEGEDAGSVALWTHDDGVSEIGWMVLPRFQRRGLGRGAVAMILERARADGRWGPIHAYPTVTNEASNAMCRTLGFDLLETIDGEYSGRPLRLHHWCWDPGRTIA